VAQATMNEICGSLTKNCHPALNFGKGIEFAAGGDKLGRLGEFGSQKPSRL
jgi:hypothetical protein